MADPSPTASGPPPTDRSAAEQAYWRRNLRYLAVLLAIWFLVSYGAGILLVEPLNAFRVPGTGFPLGFWFAQQGSIYVFVALIFVYVWLMNRLDRRYQLDELDEPTGGGAS
jgi:putative solute:sodium symporter small subunit